MGLVKAFDDYQDSVNADIEQVRLARARRDVFKKALGAEDDVEEVFGSGSLARSTQLAPIHDVDLVVVFDADAHPTWGTAGDAAQEALSHLGGKVHVLLGATHGTVDQLVRLADPRNHAVKCFLDDPEDPDAFTVDAMPALRQPDNTLLIPEVTSRDWVSADPEYLINEVAKRQVKWPYFRPMVRVLKNWRLGVPVEGKIKSLVMEILALDCLPTAGSRPEALRAFFSAAAVRVNEPITDPADLCGEIQPDLDRVGLRDALNEASELATQACAAAANGATDDALQVWAQLFGTDFPAPAKKQTSPSVAAPALITSRPVKDAPQG
ncbi:hypothetical protein GCM10027176_52110 [Actinoallomurus bryophytorum]|uniref:Nucleotidyltransferase-like protein n=1 Tax=Actinoallomurus bryophytorum TaxID=1490222 RepID=A0A543CHH2_9ACTN|nr:hypothetical protein [Actinoallomurus bryophytorum]TQL96553.1 hypothetical protein FB559_2092 [Actinoallomurus bryophytorum]